MMTTIKCQVKLSKEVWDGWNEVLPKPYQFTIYYIHVHMLKPRPQNPSTDVSAWPRCATCC